MVLQNLFAVRHAHVRLVLHLKRVAAEDDQQRATQLERWVAVEHERRERDEELTPDHSEHPVVVVRLEVVVHLVVPLADLVRVRVLDLLVTLATCAQQLIFHHQLLVAEQDVGHHGWVAERVQAECQHGKRQQRHVQAALLPALLHLVAHLQVRETVERVCRRAVEDAQDRARQVQEQVVEHDEEAGRIRGGVVHEPAPTTQDELLLAVHVDVRDTEEDGHADGQALDESPLLQVRHLEQALRRGDVQVQVEDGHELEDLLDHRRPRHAAVAEDRQDLEVVHTDGDEGQVDVVLVHRVATDAQEDDQQDEAADAHHEQRELGALLALAAVQRAEADALALGRGLVALVARRTALTIVAARAQVAATACDRRVTRHRHWHILTLSTPDTSAPRLATLDRVVLAQLFHTHVLNKVVVFVHLHMRHRALPGVVAISGVHVCDNRLSLFRVDVRAQDVRSVLQPEAPDRHGLSDVALALGTARAVQAPLALLTIRSDVTHREQQTTLRLVDAHALGRVALHGRADLDRLVADTVSHRSARHVRVVERADARFVLDVQALLASHVHRN
mmetsp:Transcript_109302/g.265619  ORF Transcript_109302/g.265619 Transcript_109302/m.265619 type:complete len:563 (+) Transcript_109302:1008-2696(+)